MGLIRYFQALLHQLTRIADALERIAVVLDEQTTLYSGWLDTQPAQSDLEEPYYSRWLAICKLNKQTADKNHAYAAIMRDLRSKEEATATAPLPESEQQA